MWNAADVQGLGLKKTDDKNWRKASSSDRAEINSL